jgi:dTDP-6-deoxy-L-talose 4-dehydrogenase (NAD+)
MKVAVTGATGFVGRHVLRALAERPGIEIVASSRGTGAGLALPGDARHVPLDMARPSPDDYERLGRPDVLIHLAWGGLPNYRSLHHFETELPRQYQFLRSLVQAGLPSVFVAGTCYEYGMRCGELQESLIPEPANPYGFAKTALLRQLEFLRSTSPFELTWGRLFFMYGEGQAPTSLYAMLMSAIDRQDLSFKMSGGEQLRDFLPATRVAQDIVTLAVHQGDSGIVNICSGQPISVRNLVERLLRDRRATLDLELGAYPYPDHEPMAFWGSALKLDALLRGTTART